MASYLACKHYCEHQSERKVALCYSLRKVYGRRSHREAHPIPCNQLHRQQCLNDATNFPETFLGRTESLKLMLIILTEGGEADWTDDFPVVHSFEEGFVRTHDLVCG